MRTDVLCALIGAVLAVLCFYPILGASLTDADGYLQHVSAIAGFDRIALPDVYAEIAHHSSRLQPGWFPLGSLPFAIWLADPPVRVARAMQLGLVTLSFATFAVVVRRLFDSKPAAVLTVVFALAFWQLRMPHDPIVGTSFVMPWLAEWVLLGFLSWELFSTSGTRTWLICSYLCIVAMMLTAPVGCGLAALLAASASLERRYHREAAGSIALVVALAGFELLLGGYRVPWERAGSYGRYVLAQSIAPLPGSYRALGHLPVGGVAGFWHGQAFVDDRYVRIPAVEGWQWLWVVVAATVAFVSLRGSPARQSSQFVEPGRSLLLGLGFWLIPAFVLGPPSVWRSVMPLGQSFDVVYVQYFGVAILATVGLLRVRRGRNEAGLLAPPLCGLFVFLLCYGNTRANAVTLGKAARVSASNDLIERAASARFFDLLPDGTTVAVTRGESYADGIHASVSDARYALYHYSKRRYKILATDRLRGSPSTNIWILRTSRTTGVFVTVARWWRTSGTGLMTDRAYGFSVVPDLREAFKGAQRGLDVRLLPLRDGFAIDARRTCGAVPIDGVYTAQAPEILWGPGFYRRGPIGYSNYQLNADGAMLMGPTASLLLRPTPCIPGRLTFNALVSAARPSRLRIATADDTRYYRVSNAAERLTLSVPASAEPVLLTFKTDAPTADLDPIPFRYVRDRPRDLRLMFSSASVSEESAPTVRSSNRR